MQQQREREKQSNKQYRVVGKTTILHMDKGGVLQISSDRDVWMGEKIKTQKNPLGFKQNPKKLDQNLTPPKIPCLISEP